MGRQAGPITLNLESGWSVWPSAPIRNNVHSMTLCSRIVQMSHVWDHFDYTNDVGWWKSQGWPLLKVIQNSHFRGQISLRTRL